MRSIPAHRRRFISSSGEVRKKKAPEGGASIYSSAAGAAMRTGVVTSVNPRESNPALTDARTLARNFRAGTV
jgi:hypothetical protein